MPRGKGASGDQLRWRHHPPLQNNNIHQHHQTAAIIPSASSLLLVYLRYSFSAMSTRRSPQYSYCDCIILSRRCRRRFVASIFFVILIASSQPSPSVSASASSSFALFSTPLRHDRRPGLLHVVCRAPSSAFPPTATTIIITHALPSLSASLTLTSHIMRPMNAVNGNSNSDCGGSSIEQNCIQDDNDDDNTMSDTTMAFDDLPRHIAFICDGNSRWSEQQQRQ